MMTAVMRRRIGRADRAFAEHQRLTREALVARAARDAERQQNRDLHDTVLGTLTMVGLGAVAGPSTAFRDRCAADLRTLVALTDLGPVPGDGPVPLDGRLRAVPGRLPELRVDLALASCAVPAGVADAITESAYAALSNVVRHAPGARATLRLARDAVSVVVEVVDDGPGFDPATVAPHRYGLRESIHGRMAAVGGRAEVTLGARCGHPDPAGVARCRLISALRRTAPDPRGTGRGAAVRRGDRAAAPGPAMLAAPAAVAHASDRGARIVAVAIALAWHVAIGLPAVLAARTEFAAPAVVLGCWALVAVTGAVAGVRLLRGTPLPPWPLAGLLLAVDAAVFASVGERQLFTAANWVWGTLGWFFVLALWGRRVHGLVVLLTTHALIALAAVLAHGHRRRPTWPATPCTSTAPSRCRWRSSWAARRSSRLARDRAAVSAAGHAMAAERAAAERGLRERRDRLALVGARGRAGAGRAGRRRGRPGRPGGAAPVRAGRGPAAPADRRVRRRARPAAARAAGRRRPGRTQRAADRPGHHRHAATAAGGDPPSAGRPARRRCSPTPGAGPG